MALPGSLAVLVSLLMVSPGLVWAGSEAARSPYAAEAGRAVSSLSQDEMDALLAGAGMGFAKPAELNGYPGPRHVLDLADELALSAEQRRAIEAIFERMQARAKALGREYIEAEKALDRVFQAERIAPQAMKARLAIAAQTHMALRTTHLAAHLETAPLLTPEQHRLYQVHRGYVAANGADDTPHAHGAGHHAQ